jgi:hypothetical protein
VAREEQLQWEKKAGKPAAAAAFLSALLGMAGFFYQRSITPAPTNDAQFLVSLDGNPSDYLVGTIFTAVSTLLLAPVLYYLFRATKARRDLIPHVALILAFAAPIAYGGVVIASTLQQTSAAHEYVRDVPGAKDIKVGAKADKKVDDKKGSLNDKARDKRASGPGVLAGVSIASTLAMALAFVLICLHAMRAGLVGRFMGSLGMVIGALYIFQFLVPPGLVELLWLPALGLIFLDRFPQGRGPAWDSGEAIPWPSAVEKRDALSGVPAKPRPARGGWGARARAPEPVEDDGGGEDVADDPPTTTPHTREAARPRESPQHPRSKKRKRKRR